MTFEEWWREQTRKGDPMRRTHLVEEAWNAAKADDILENRDWKGRVDDLEAELNAAGVIHRARLEELYKLLQRAHAIFVASMPLNAAANEQNPITEWLADYIVF